MQLSKRMELLASKVSEGSRLADVGTDHGYIPIALVLRGRIPSAIAMDVNSGPLKRAEEHIRTRGLTTYIETRLSDGLTALSAGEADTVLIAGMGGALTVRILEGGAHCLASVRELVLQPQSEIHLVRRWLGTHGWRIAEEDIVRDEGKYYPMMKAVYGEPDPMGDAEYFYGRADIQNSPDILKQYLEQEIMKNEKLLEVLEASGQGSSVRMQELREKEGRLRGTLEALRF